MPGSTNAILSEEELQAAMAEFESAPEAEKAAIPSIGDAPAVEVVPVPIHHPQPEKIDEVKSPAADAAPAPAAPPPVDATAIKAPGAKPRFAMKPKSSTGDAPAAPLGAAGAGAGKAAADAGAAQNWFARLLLALVDAILAAINRPFYWLPDGARQIIGYSSAATLLVSVAAMFALPVLWPYRDLAERAHERRIAAEAARVEAARAAAEKANPPPGEHGKPAEQKANAHAPPAGGHGGH